MRTRIATFFSLSFIILLSVPHASKAQPIGEEIDKTYTWAGETKSENVYINIKEHTSQMMINMDGSAKKGELEVTIYNPEGEKFPGFILISDGSSGSSTSVVNVSTGNGTNSVSTSSTSISTSKKTTSSNSSSSSSNSDEDGSYSYTTSISAGSGAKGVMNKVLTDPMPGKWKFEIAAKKLKGELTLSINQN